MNAANAFTAEYRTNTRGLFQEIEDLKLSNKTLAQALQEVVGKIDRYASARINEPATDDMSEENAGRLEQHAKERRELSCKKSTTSNVGD